MVAMMMSSRCKVVIAALLVVLVVVDASKHLKRIKHQLKPAAGGNYDVNGMSSFSFLVVGDWGRKGEYNQSMVATQMGKVGEKLDVEFIISTGDNFYDDGLTGVNDPAFIESFTNIYTAPALQKQWFNVLGNHDYRGDVEAQLSPTLRRKDKRWFCLRSYIIEASASVDFFMVDTTPFVDKYFTDPEDHTYDWSGITPREKYLSTLLNDLDLALSESKASWKIVVGHHTIKSAGHHGNTEELILHLLPILHQNKVDFYINGHDHCLERIVSSHKSHAIEFITSGGGSKAWRGDEQSWDPNELKFYYDGQGFLSAQLNASYIHFEFYDVYGQSLYQWDSFKELRYDV